MDIAAAISHIKQRGNDIFGTRISLSVCGELYTTIVKGRLYIWNPDLDGFQILLSVPHAGGTIDLVAVEEIVRRPNDISLAAGAADRMFRDWSEWPARALQYGHEAEDLFLEVCFALGFVNALEVGPETKYTVRRARPREDLYQHTDFVFTFPDPDDAGSRLTVPLQLTTADAATEKLKREKVDTGVVAYLPLDLFIGSYSLSRGFLRRTRDGWPYNRWLFGEILKIVIQRYLKHPVSLPIDQPFKQEYCCAASLSVLMPRLKQDVEDKVLQLLAQPDRNTQLAHGDIRSYLLSYVETYGTVYETDLAAVQYRGW